MWTLINRLQHHRPHLRNNRVKGGGIEDTGQGGPGEVVGVMMQLFEERQGRVRVDNEKSLSKVIRKFLISILFLINKILTSAAIDYN